MFGGRAVASSCAPHSQQLKFINGRFAYSALGSNILTLSYETSPACNVLVSENPEITAAKSTVQGTNKATSNRAKTSTPSTLSSASASSASVASSSSSSSSSSSAASSSASLSTNNNQSSGSSAAAASSGGNENNFNKRYRRSLPDPKPIAIAPINIHAGTEHRVPCTTTHATSNCANSKNVDASAAMRSPPSDVVTRNLPHSTKSPSDPTLIDANQLIDRNPGKHSPNTRASNEFILDDDFEIDNEHPSAKTFNENFNIVSDMLDDGSGHHASSGHIASTSKDNNNNDFDGKIIDDKIPVEGDDAILLNDAPSIIFYDSPTDGGAASRKDDDRPIDEFSDSSNDAVAAAPNPIVEVVSENENVITAHSNANSVRDKYIYNVVAGDTTNDNERNEIPNENERNDDEHDVFVETASSAHQQQPEFHMLDDTNRLANDSQSDPQTQRILVNVSIATDSGVGTQNHGIYMLHVSVPVGPEFMSNIDFQNVSHMHQPHTVNVTPSFQKNADSPSPACPCDCDAAALRNATERESMANESTTQIANGTISTSPPSPPSSSSTPPPIEENRFCLNEQDIPPILILEGEPYR